MGFSKYILEISDLKKVYKKGQQSVLANDGVSLKLKPREVVGIVGENGSGKTTLLNQVMGLISSTSGTIKFSSTNRTPRDIGYMSQYRVDVFEHLTLKEALFYASKFKKLSKKESQDIMNDLIGFFDLDSYLGRMVSTLSGGYRQILDFCIAVLGTSSLLILDEPLNNLDPVFKKKIISYLNKNLDKLKLATIIVSHNLEEIESIVERVVIFKKGKIIENCTPQEAKLKYDRFLYFVVNSPDSSTLKKLEVFSKENKCEILKDINKIIVKISFDLSKNLWQFLSSASGIDINNTNFKIQTGTLENVYLNIFDKKMETA
ncbi:MAG: hypothetical protein CMP21_08670 [Rickettsiales bacterium]|nr:hypothetical protein [Rickettsiales bacterium]|tara:strand:+ start:320 stop:1273 length:954 start_codon:yes stop_codon:yes gene_type:complete